MMQIQFNNYQPFNGRGARHGAKNIQEVMTKLYRSAYNNELYPHTPDIIQVSAKMKDGTEVTGIANFIGGVFEGISFPYEYLRYRSEFCNKIIDKYNLVITKGKCLKK